MGKRELVLIAGFVALGGLVYWYRAAPAPADEQGLSLSRVVRSIQADVSGTRTTRPIVASGLTVPASGVGTVEVEPFEGTLVVTGAATDRITAELSGEAYGLDEDDAAGAARQPRVRFETRRDVLQVHLEHPPRRRQPNLTLTLTVPAHLAVALSEHRGRLDVRGIRSIALGRTRAEVRIADIAEAVTGRLERSALNDISRVNRVELETERAELVVTDAAGPVTIRAERGNIYLHRVHGPITIHVDQGEVDVDANTAPLTVEARRGRIALHAARAPVIIDSRNVDVRVVMAESVPVTVTARDGRVDLTLPAHAGVQVEATVHDGTLYVPDALPVDESGQTRSARGPLSGGGAPVVVDARAGTLIIREPARPAS